MVPFAGFYGAENAACFQEALKLSPIIGSRGNLNRSRPEGKQHHPRRRGAAAGGSLMS
jgi:hypothetical protein